MTEKAKEVPDLSENGSPISHSASVPTRSDIARVAMGQLKQRRAQEKTSNTPNAVSEVVSGDDLRELIKKGKKRTNPKERLRRILDAEKPPSP